MSSRTNQKNASEVATKGILYLKRNSRQWEAETDNGLRFKDNFVQFLMLEATGDWRLVDLRLPSGKWNYFGGKAVVTTDPYPPDIDTQSVANTVLKAEDSRAHVLLDEILACENEEGIIPLYFDKSRPRVCVEVCANICTFFYTFGRGHEVRKTFDLVLNTLKTRDFGVKRYYFTPEPLFYYCFRLINSAQAPELDHMREVLKGCVQERIGTDTDNAVVLAIRLLICQKLRIPNMVDLSSLLQLQEDDGGFGVGWYYNFGRSKVKIGHRGFTATLSVEAIKGALEKGHVKESVAVVEPHHTQSQHGGGYLTWVKKWVGMMY